MNTSDKLTITSSVTKNVYIRPCISLIRYHMQYTSEVWFSYLYFGGWKRSFLNQNCFEMTNFQALNTLTTYSNISKIRLWIQISLCGNARIQMDISKKNGFLSRESNKLFSLAPRKEIRYQHVKCLSPSGFSPLPGFQFSHGNWRQKHTEAALRFLHQLNWSCIINAKWLPDIILSQRALS